MRTQTNWRVPVLILATLIFTAPAANGQSPQSATVVPLGVPGVSAASTASASQVCGLRVIYDERRNPVETVITVLDLVSKQVTSVTSTRSAWNQNGEDIADVVCPNGDVWFTSSSRTKSLWHVVNGTPIPVLRPGGSFGRFIYSDEARLVGNASRAVLIGKFGSNTLAFTFDGKQVGDFGSAPVFDACATDKSLIAVAQYSYPFGKFAIVTRSQPGKLDFLGWVPDLGNDGSTNTALRNLTHSVGCSADTSSFMIRTTTTSVWTIKDSEVTATRIFTGSTAGNFPLLNFWGVSIDANDKVSFAMDAKTPGLGDRAIVRISNGAAIPVATEGVDFSHIIASGINPLAVGSRLVFFQTPTGGGYEVK